MAKIKDPLNYPTLIEVANSIKMYQQVTILSRDSKLEIEHLSDSYANPNWYTFRFEIEHYDVQFLSVFIDFRTNPNAIRVTVREVVLGKSIANTPQMSRWKFKRASNYAENGLANMVCFIKDSQELYELLIALDEFI